MVGALGKGLAGEPAKPTADPLSCKAADGAERAARNGAAYLVKALAKDKYLTSALPGAKDQPDYGNTADAVLALATAGHGDKAADTMRWLEAHSAQWAEQGGPAAYAQLILAADAETFDPRDFGGRDLVKQLNATGPAPASLPSEPTPSASASAVENAKKDDNGVSIWWIIGVGLVGGIGIGFLISARNKKQQP